MQNVKKKLWSGTILIQQDSLPGLSLGDEIRVDIFHEEASKQNRVNFDWDSSTNKIAKFWRFPKWSLKSKKPEANLLPFIKDSAIVKLSLPDGEDHSKFASLVECLAKVGKEAFCGYLRVEEDSLRPLCLMVTERGLLGFCVDSIEEDPNIADEVEEKNSVALFAKFEETLTGNFAKGNGKSKVRKDQVDIKDLLNPGSDGNKSVNENITSSTEVTSEYQVISQVHDSQESISSSDQSLYPHGITRTTNNSFTFNLLAAPTSSLKDEAMEIARNVLSKSAVDTTPISTVEDISPTPLHPTRPSIPPPPSAKYKSDSAGGCWRVWTGELGLLGSAWQLTVNPPKGLGQPKTFEVEKSNLRELGLDNTRTKNLITTDAKESDEEVKLFFGSKFLSVPKTVFQEELMDVEEERISHLSKNKGCENGSDLQEEENEVVDVSDNIADWTSSEVKTENSKGLSHSTMSTSRNPSIREKALTIARNVLIQQPVQENSYKEEEEQFSKSNKDLVTSNLPFNPLVTSVISKTTIASSSSPKLPPLCPQPGPSPTFRKGESFIVDGKDPTALKIYSTTKERGSEVLHPVNDHDYVSATMKVPQNQKKTGPDPKYLYHPPPVSSVAKYLFNQNHVVKDGGRKEVKPVIDFEKAEKGKEYFSRKFASIGLSRMKEMKLLFFKYLNKESSSAEFVQNSKLTEASQVTSAIAFLETNFPHLREAILIGKVKISDLHWILNDTMIDDNGIIADAEVNKKEKEDQKLSKLCESHLLSTTLAIPLEYQGHAECKISIRQDSFKEYLAIFTKHHVLFCSQSIRLPLKLVQDYSLQNKVWNEVTEGKVYLPDMIFPTKLNEVHFFVVQDSQSYKEKILNLGNLQASSSLITKENFLKFSQALTEENPGILMSWNMINPTFEESMLLINDTSVFLSEVNAITSSPQESIDIFHDSIERLIDVPGVDDEIALKICKARIQAKTLINFIQRDDFGFELLTDIVQLDVGLLARKDLALCYNGATMNFNSSYLKILEQNLFQNRFYEWRRPDNIPCIIMVAVLGFLSGRHGTRPRAHVLKILIEKQGGFVEKSWVKFGKTVISFMEGPVLLQVNTTAKVSPTQKPIGNDLKISKDAPKKITPSKLKLELKKGVTPSKIGRFKELKVPKQCDEAGKKTCSNLLAVLNISTTPQNNNNIKVNACSDTKTKVEKPKDQTLAKESGFLKVKSLRGIEDISRRKNSSSRSAQSDSSSVGLDIVGSSVVFSNASPVKLPTNLNPPPKHPSLAMPVVSQATGISSSLECTKQSSDVLSPVLASSTSCSYSPPGSPLTASTSMPGIGGREELTNSSSHKNKVAANIDAKLFLEIFVEVEELSNTKLRKYIRNDNDDIVTLEGAFDNHQLYAEPIFDAVENVLPSLESKLELMKKNKDSKKAMFECSLCKKVFSDHEDRHQHYCSAHCGPPIAVKDLSEKQFECKLCDEAFIDCQGRHEHYMYILLLVVILCPYLG